jgi:hypothetical protein
VIGGAPAAATIFAREISARTENDLRVTVIRPSESSQKTSISSIG